MEHERNHYTNRFSTLFLLSYFILCHHAARMNISKAPRPANGKFKCEDESIKFSFKYNNGMRLGSINVRLYLILAIVGISERESEQFITT